MEASKCPRCYGQTRLRLREFSEQAYATLIHWGELEAKTFNKPICNVCFEDLRETLIDRADEMTTPAPLKRPAKRRKPADKVV